MNSTIEQMNSEYSVGRASTDTGTVERGEMRKFFDDVEELLGRVGHFNDVDLDRLKTKVQTSMRAARESTHNATRRVREVSRQAATSADNYAHEKPWTIVSLAAVAGLAIGAVMAGRR